jgi:hypothetical protein
MKRHKQKAWSSLQASTFSLMPDFQHEMVYLPLIVGFVTISLNGAVQIYGMISLILLSPFKFTCQRDYRPRTKEELFNLCHLSACNVIEHIFGVLKQRFRNSFTASCLWSQHPSTRHYLHFTILFASGILMKYLYLKMLKMTCIPLPMHKAT